MTATVLFYSSAFCQVAAPKIPELASRDNVFKQYQQDIMLNNMAVAQGKSQTFFFYTYDASKDDNLLELSARCSLLYDTIASANGIAAMNEDLTGRTLVLPTFQALFVPLAPESTIEIIMQKQHASSVTEGTPIITFGGRKFYVLLGERFSGTERAFFLDTNFRLPLEKSVLTSSFGYRVSPISGAWKFHNGIDMAAPRGTTVFACKGGTVTQVLENDAVYGNCITIRHDGGITSVYAHLDEVYVKKDDTVRSGDRIGCVGLTGATTGPHLHFELRQNGSSVDPYEYIPNLPQ